MSIQVSNIDFRSVALVNPTNRNLVSLDGSSATTPIKTYEGLKSVFNIFEDTLEGLNLPDGIQIIPYWSGLGPENKLGLVIKKVEPGHDAYYPGDAFIFEFEMNDKTKFNEIRWGLASHSDEGQFFNGSDHYQYASQPRTTGWLRDEFGKFLDEALPIVSDWDREISEREFANANPSSGQLPAWWMQRAVASLITNGAETIEVDGDQIDAEDVQEFADAKMIKAVKLGPDTFELVSA